MAGRRDITVQPFAARPEKRGLNLVAVVLRLLPMVKKMRLKHIQNFVKQQEDTLHAAVICLACYGVFEEAAKEESCENCGHRYNPEIEGDKCPECGDDNYICHCPGCDAEDPPYLVDVVDDMDNYFESEHPQQLDVFDNIETFLASRATG